MRRHLSVSFEQMLDGDTKERVKQMVVNNLIDYQRENGIITGFDRNIDKAKRMMMLATSDNDILCVIKILGIIQKRQKPASELDIRLWNLFKSVEI